jgi:hypothetical protein
MQQCWDIIHTLHLLAGQAAVLHNICVCSPVTDASQCTQRWLHQPAYVSNQHKATHADTPWRGRRGVHPLRHRMSCWHSKRDVTQCRHKGIVRALAKSSCAVLRNARRCLSNITPHHAPAEDRLHMQPLRSPCAILSTSSLSNIEAVRHLQMQAHLNGSRPGRQPISPLQSRREPPPSTCKQDGLQTVVLRPCSAPW